MRKFFFFLLMVLCTMVLPAFGQKLSNSDVAKIISQSRGYNNQIVNPDLVYPKQILTYRFMDGFVDEIEVEKNDYQWKLVQKLDSLIRQHGSIIEPDSTIIQPTPVQPELESPEKSVFASTTAPWFPLLIFGIIVLLILASFAIVNWKKIKEEFYGKFSANPASEGKPFVEGGVKAENVQNHFVDLSLRNNPGLDSRKIVVKDQQRKYVSTPSAKRCRVRFGDGTSQLLSFRNILGWTAMVSVDEGKTFGRQVYFEECGNPLYFGKGMKAEDLILSDTPINFGNEPTMATSLEEKQETKKMVVEKSESEKPEIVVSEIPKSEYLTQTEEAFKLAKDVLGNGDAHSALFEIPKGPEGIFRMTITTQYPKGSGKNTEKEK